MTTGTHILWWVSPVEPGTVCRDHLHHPARYGFGWQRVGNVVVVLVDVAQCALGAEAQGHQAHDFQYLEGIEVQWQHLQITLLCETGLRYWQTDEQSRDQEPTRHVHFKPTGRRVIIGHLGQSGEAPSAANGVDIR